MAPSGQDSKLQGLRTQRTQEVAALDAQTGRQLWRGGHPDRHGHGDPGQPGLGRAAPVAQHAKKRMMLYVGSGLLAGLALRLGIVVIRALVSDKLRRRDEIASALGVPVKLSAGRCA